MSTIHLPQQRPASGPAPATAAPAGEPGWSRVLLVAGSRAALAVVLSLVVWSVLPAALGWSPRVIMSGSMEPRIHVGDVVVDRPVDPASLTEGRIITVTDPDHPEKTRTHRFQQRDEDGRLVTRGDANQAADSTPVDPDEVLGVAAIRVPYVGLPVTWLAQGQLAPVGIAVTVLLLLGLAATTPLRLVTDAEETDRDEPGDGRDDSDGPDDDAGLTILTPAAAARRREQLRADAPRRGGRVTTRSSGRGVRRIGVAGSVVGAVLASLATTGTTYAAFSEPTPNPSSSFTAAATFSTADYAATVMADTPQLFWRFEETGGSTAADSSGSPARPGTADNPRWGQSGALLSAPTSRALGLDGGSVTQQGTIAVGDVYTLEIWVSTTRTTGGPLLTLNAGPTLHRALYLGQDGRVRFGRDNAATVTSDVAVNDGDWHHVVYTSASTGAAGSRGRLYVDGRLAGTGSTVSGSATGSWRVGFQAWTGSWPGNPDQYLRGTVDEVAIDSVTLSDVRVQAHYDASGR